MVFADADFFIGLYFKEDAHYEVCRKIIESIEEEILTSWDVIDEVSTKLTYFVNQKASIIFLRDVFSSKFLVIFPDWDLSQKARVIFENQKSHMISMTDCMNMAIAREKGVTGFLSFDKVYEKNGFKLVK